MLESRQLVLTRAERRPSSPDQERPIFQEHAQVVLACPLPALGLEPGDVGVVIHVHGQGAAYEVEFISLDGRTIGLQTLEAHQLRPVSASAVPHERLRAAA